MSFGLDDGGSRGRDGLTAEQFAGLLKSGSAGEVFPGRIDDQALLRLLLTASRSQLEAVMSSELRTAVLTEIFRRMGGYVRSARAVSKRSVVHWRIGDRPDGGYDEFETILDGTGVTLSAGLINEPRVTMTTGPVEFLSLVSGRASGPMLFITGKLKIKGDLGFAAGLPSIFAIPDA